MAVSETFGFNTDQTRSEYKPRHAIARKGLRKSDEIIGINNISDLLRDVYGRQGKAY